MRSIIITHHSDLNDVVEIVFEIAENDQRWVLRGHAETVPQVALRGGKFPQSGAQAFDGEAAHRLGLVEHQRQTSTRRAQPGQIGPARR